MNKGNYGYPQAPNRSTQIAPPEWRNGKLITATTSTEIVPLNVYQMLVMVFGGGANGSTSGGAGGGFAMGIIDVVPGQTLPTITVGAVGGTSSLGTLLSATGGSAATGGTGTAAAHLRNRLTASGGAGGGANTGGAASGSPLGDGGASLAQNSGGMAWGGVQAISTVGATTISSIGSSADGLLAIANRKGLPGQGATSASVQPGIGCGAFSQADNSSCIPSVIGGGGGGGSTKGGAAGLGGGGGNSATTGGAGGAGCVILYWTEGY